MDASRSHVGCLMPLFCAVALAVPLGSSSVAAERLGAPGDQQWIADLLRACQTGDRSSRESLLRSAPASIPAGWVASLRGQVRSRDATAAAMADIDNDSPDVKATGRLQMLEAYESRRAAIDGSADSHWQLSQWCRAVRLPARSIAHAKLAVRQDDQFAPAQRRLGRQPVGQSWVEPQQARQAEDEAERVQRSMRRFGKGLQRLVDLQATRPETTESLWQKLDDPAAIDAVSMVAVLADVEAVGAAAGWLSDRQEPESAVALARIAVFHPSYSARQLAVEALSQKDPHLFVPTCLRWCGGAVTMEQQVNRAADGTILAVRRQTIVDHGDAIDQEQATTAVSTRFRGGRPEMIHRELANTQLENLITAEENRLRQTYQDRNRELDVILGRVATLLAVDDPQLDPTTATLPDLHRRWYDRNGHRLGPDRPTRYFVRSNRYEDEYDVPPPAVFSSGCECLIGTTLIWTDQGPRPVESLREGDQVLSCQSDSGELRYAAVLQRTHREPEPTVTMSVGGDRITSTDGHLFWVPGRGWTLARELSVGDALHTAEGSARIDAIETSPVSETFNLEVDGTHSYFVGEQRVLSHDVTLRTDAAQPLPGLTFAALESPNP